MSIVGPSEARPADGLAVDFVVESNRVQLSEIVQRVRDGRLRPNIGNVATLDNAVAAFNPTERRVGKTIIRVRPWRLRGVVGGEHVRWPLVHREDLADLYLLALNEELREQSYIGAAIPGLPVGRLARAIAQRFGLRDHARRKLFPPMQLPPNSVTGRVAARWKQ